MKSKRILITYAIMNRKEVMKAREVITSINSLNCSFKSFSMMFNTIPYIFSSPLEHESQCNQDNGHENNGNCGHSNTVPHISICLSIYIRKSIETFTNLSQDSRKIFFMVRKLDPEFSSKIVINASTNNSDH